MFFQVIQPLLAKGLKFNLSIEADDSIPGNVIVGVFPDAGEKSTSLTPAMFSGTPQELDAQFDQVMAGFVTVTKSLTEQLEDARLVAEQAAKDALESAAVVQKPRKPASSKSPISTTSVGPEGDDDEGGNDQDTGSDTAMSPQVPTQAPAQAAPAALFTL